MDAAAPPALTISFADAEVASARLSEAGLELRFAALPATLAGTLATQGYVQGVELRLALPRPATLPPGCIGRVREGRLAAQGPAQHGRPLPLPWAHDGPVTLELQFANGTQLLADGSAATLGCAGEPHFVEDLRC